MVLYILFLQTSYLMRMLCLQNFCCGVVHVISELSYVDVGFCESTCSPSPRKPWRDLLVFEGAWCLRNVSCSRDKLIYIGRRPCYICLLPNGNRDDSDGSLEQCRIHIILECRLLPPCHTICVIGWLNGWIIISTSSTATTPQYMCDVGSESSASSL